MRLAHAGICPLQPHSSRIYKCPLSVKHWAVQEPRRQVRQGLELVLTPDEVCGPVASASPGSLLEIKFSGSGPDLLNQNLQEGGRTQEAGFEQALQGHRICVGV